MKILKILKHNKIFIKIFNCLIILNFAANSFALSFNKNSNTIIKRHCLAPKSQILNSQDTIKYNELDVNNPYVAKILFELNKVKKLNLPVDLKEPSLSEANEEQIDITPLYLEQLNQMSDKELRNIISEFESEARNYHHNVRETFLTQIYGKNILRKIIKYENLVVKRAIEILRSRSDDYEDLLIANASPLPTPYLTITRKININSESPERLYPFSPTKPDKTPAKIIPIRKELFNPFPGDAKISIHLKTKNWKEDIFKKTPLKRTRKNVNEILEALTENQNLIVSNFHVKGNGVISFGRPENKVFGQSYFCKLDKKHIGQHVALEFKEGKPIAVYDKDLNEIYRAKTDEEIKESQINIHPFKENWRKTINRDKPLEQLDQESHTIANELGNMLKQNPNIVISNYTLRSKGGLFLQKKFIWHIKRGYENKNVYLIFKDGELDSVYTEDFKNIYKRKNAPTKKKKQTLGVHFLNNDWKTAIKEHSPEKEIKKSNININKILSKSPDVLISDFPLRDNHTLYLNGEYIGQYKNHKKVHLEFRSGNLFRVWGEDLKDSYDIVSPRDQDIENKALIFKWTDQLNNLTAIENLTHVDSFTQSAKDSKKMLEQILEKHPDILISNYELRSTGSLFVLGKLIWGENSKYRKKENNEKVYLKFSNKQLEAVYDSNFNEIPFVETASQAVSKQEAKPSSREIQHPQKKNLIKIFLPQKEGIKASLKNKQLDEFYQVNFEKIKNAVKEHKNVIISNFMLRGNGALKLFDENFEEKSYWDSKEKLKHANVHLEFINGSLFRVYDQSFNIIYEAKKDTKPDRLKVYKMVQDKNGQPLTENSLIEIKTDNDKFSSLEKILTKEPDITVTGHLLNSQGRVYLGKRLLPKSGYITPDSIKGERDKHAHKEIIMTFKNGKLFQVFDTDFKPLHQVKNSYEKEQELLRVYPYSDNWKEQILTEPSIQRIEKSSSNIKDIVNKYEDIVIRNFVLPPGGTLFIDNEEIFTKKNYGNIPVTLVYREKKLYEVWTETFENLYPDSIQIFRRNENWKEDIFNEKSKPLMETKKDSKIILDALNKNNGNIIIKNFFIRSKGRVHIDKDIFSSMDHEYQHVTLEFKDHDLIGVYDKEMNQIYDGTPWYAYPFGENWKGDIQKEDYPGEKLRFNQVSDAAIKKYLKQNPDAIISNYRLDKNGGLKLFSIFEWRTRIEYANKKVYLHFKNQKLSAVYDENFNKIHQTYNESMEILESMDKSGELIKLKSIFGFSTTCKLVFKLCNKIPPKILIQRIYEMLGKKPVSQKMWKTNSNSHAKDFLNSVKKLNNHFDQKDPQYLDLITRELITASYAYYVKDPNFKKLLKDALKEANAGSLISKIYNAILHFYEENDEQNIKGITVPLKFYQRIAAKFIEKNKKVIIGDDPGLGKSLSALAAAVNAHNGKGAKKVLIISPRISKENVWVPEIEKHLKGINKTCVLNRPDQIKRKKKLKELDEAKFVIVSYEMLTDTYGTTREVREKLLEYGFDFIILDEGHKIRNDSSFTEAVKYFKADYQVILSGTPLIGRYSKKLYPLINWIRPDIFDNSEEFSELTRSMNGFYILKDILSDIMLRRKTEEVFVDTPDLNIEIDYLPMKEEQRQIYNEAQKNIFNMHPDTIITGLPKLKMLATSPGLFRKVELKNENNEIFPMEIGSNKILLNGKEFHIKFEHLTPIAIEKKDGFNVLNSNPIDNGFVLIDKIKYSVNTEALLHTSNKFDEVDRLINKATVENEKIVVFTGFVDILKHLSAKYKDRGIGVDILYGEMNEKSRKETLNTFNASKESRILFATYQTGGESINLSTAKYGVLIDPPWTLQERKQIYHRLYRMGIEHDIFFNVLLSKHTIDEHTENLSLYTQVIENILFGEFDFKFNDKDIQNQLLDLVYDKASFAPDFNKPEPSIKHKQKTLVTKLKEGKRELEYNSETGKLKGYLSGKFSKETIPVYSISQLFSQNPAYDKNSYNFFKKLLIKHLKNEIETNINPNKSIVKIFLEFSSENFKLIDYDPFIEKMIRYSSIILMNLLKNPDINVEELKVKCAIPSEMLFHQALQFLESKNIIKILSMLKIFPEKYYKNGKFKRYTHPLMASFNNLIYNKRTQNIFYRDTEKISEIMGHSTKDSFQLQHTSEITDEQKISIAKEMQNGNVAAEELLASHYTPIMKKVAYKAFGHLQSYNPAFRKLDLTDELISYSNLAFLVRVREYVVRWGWETTELDDFVIPLVYKDICRYAYNHVKEKLEFSLDKPAYDTSPNKESVIDRVASQDETPEEKFLTNEVYETFKKLLKSAAFFNDEITVLLLRFRNEYTVDEISEELNIEIPEVNTALRKFTEFISNKKPEDFLNLLHGNKNENNFPGGALKIMGGPLNDLLVNKLIHKSVSWQMQAKELKTQNIELDIEAFSPPVKLYMKILSVEDDELPAHISSWNLSGDPNNPENPLMIVVKKSMLEKESNPTILQETIYHEYREDFWKKHLFENEPNLSIREIIRQAHILASSEQLIKYSNVSTRNHLNVSNLKENILANTNKPQTDIMLENELSSYTTHTFPSRAFNKDSDILPYILKDFDTDIMKESLIIEKDYYSYLKNNPFAFRKVLSLIEDPNPDNNAINYAREVMADFLFVQNVINKIDNLSDKTEIIKVISKFINKYQDKQIYLGSKNLGKLNEIWIEMSVQLLNNNNLQLPPNNNSYAMINKAA